MNLSCAPCRILIAPALRLQEDRALHYLAQIYQASLFGGGPWAKPFERSKRCLALRSHQNGRDLCRDLIIRTNLRCTSDQCSIPLRLNLIPFHLYSIDAPPTRLHSIFSTSTKHSSLPTFSTLPSNSALSTDSSSSHQPFTHFHWLSHRLHSGVQPDPSLVHKCSHLWVRSQRTLAIRQRPLRQSKDQWSNSPTDHSLIRLHPEAGYRRL